MNMGHSWLNQLKKLLQILIQSLLEGNECNKLKTGLNGDIMVGIYPAVDCDNLDRIEDDDWYKE